MQFWKKAESFGFQLPKFARGGQAPTREEGFLQTDFFVGTDCIKMAGTPLMLDLVAQCKKLIEGPYRNCRKPCLAAILVGEDPASQVYVAHKQRRFADCGFATKLYKISSAEFLEKKAALLEDLIDQLNADAEIDGILLQLPLPQGFDATPLLDRIAPEKDVDGFHVLNMGYLASGRYEGLLPCTPYGIFALLQAYHVDVEGKNVTVVGRSNIVGKPAAYLALNARATVTVVHKLTKDILPFTRSADLLIVGAGSHNLIRAQHVQKGAVVVDVGIHSLGNGKIEGDVHEEVRQIAKMVSPVPGGVGPMTIAMLCINTAMACWGKFSHSAEF